MNANPSAIICDGCGLTASPEHIAARVARLELATRYRPIHIQMLFVGLAPMERLEDDFYRSPDSSDFATVLRSSLTASAAKEANGPEALHFEAARIDLTSEPQSAESTRSSLLDFQRQGHYLTYLSECPLTPQYSAMFGKEGSEANEWLSLLTSRLVKRIRLNYKPKLVVPIGRDMGRLRAFLEQSGVGPFPRRVQFTDYVFARRDPSA